MNTIRVSCITSIDRALVIMLGYSEVSPTLFYLVLGTFSRKVSVPRTED